MSKFSFVFVLSYSCDLCLLYDEGELEYWMYEPVDLTEQSASNAATGSTMQGLPAHHDLLP